MTVQAGPAATRATVLVVDDDPANLGVVGGLLAPDHAVKVANSGPRALHLASQAPRPDLILLDIMMPEMDGHAVLAALKADPATRDIPVIFLTAIDSPQGEEAGLRQGAVDYITKPIQPLLLLARVRVQLELKQVRDALACHNAQLEAEVARRMAENEQIQDLSIRALARLAEIREPGRSYHILRTTLYVVALAQLLRRDPRYADQLPPAVVRMLGKSVPLHDIGKVGLPDAILSKTGPYDPREREQMQTHTLMGAQALERAERDAEQPVEFLAMAKTIARWHHENWDGSGYPDGLSGDRIPLPAQLMRLADCFDALVSRPGLGGDDTRTRMREGRGHRFSPELFDVFDAHFDRFLGIAHQYRDAEPREARAEMEAP